MSIPYNPLWEGEQLLAMPFDQYQRYRLAAELIATLKIAADDEGAAWQILDVGGYFPPRPGHPESQLPLPSFLPDDETLVVDTMEYEGPHYQRASGTGLPFPDGAFDVVLSCDTLEHIPPADRTVFLAELRRVARRAVILGAPHALPGVRQAEYVLAEYLPVIGGSNEMLGEHFTYGLPQPDLVDAWLAEHNVQSVAFVSGYLPRWQVMMLAKHLLLSYPGTDETHARLDQTYNQRFYEKDQRAPGYRRVYVLAADGQSLPIALEQFVERTTLSDQDDAAADMIGLLSIPLIQALSQNRGAVGGLERMLVDLVTAYQGLFTYVQGFDQHLAVVNDLVTAYQGLFTYVQGFDQHLAVVNDLVTAYQGMSTYMQGFDQRLVSLGEQNQALGEHFMVLAEHFPVLAEHFRAQSAQIQVLSAQIPTLSNHCQELDLQHHSLRAERDALQQRYIEAVQQTAVLEGEKRGLQEQLAMLAWQNELLHQHLANLPSARAAELARSVIGRVRGRSDRG